MASERSGRRCPARRTTPRRPTPSTRSGSSTATGSTSGGPNGCRGPASWMRVEIGGESLLVVRGKDEQIRGFYNVCRHRGSRICDDEQGYVAHPPALSVPRLGLRPRRHARHHADDREGRDRPASRPRCGRCTSTSGRASSSSTSPARSRGRCSSTSPTSRTTPLGLARFGLAELRIGHISDHRGPGQLEDRAGELQRVPALPDDPPRAGRRRAGVQEGQHLRERPRGRRRLPGRRPYGDGRRPAAAAAAAAGLQGPGGDPEAYYGAGVYPTMFLDVDGSTCLATAVFPTGPQSCRLVTEYLFSPEALEDPELRPVTRSSSSTSWSPARTTRPASGCSAASPHAPSTTACSRPRTPGCTASTSATCATSSD